MNDERYRHNTDMGYFPKYHFVRCSQYRCGVLVGDVAEKLPPLSQGAGFGLSPQMLEYKVKSALDGATKRQLLYITQDEAVRQQDAGEVTSTPEESNFSTLIELDFILLQAGCNTPAIQLISNLHRETEENYSSEWMLVCKFPGGGQDPQGRDRMGGREAWRGLSEHCHRCLNKRRLAIVCCIPTVEIYTRKSGEAGTVWEWSPGWGNFRVAKMRQNLTEMVDFCSGMSRKRGYETRL